MAERDGEEVHMSDESDECSDEMDVIEEDSEDDNRRDVYLPGDPLKIGEVLTCDESAYVMLHEAQTGSPCLSFDVIKNPFNEVSGGFPMTMYMVAGTQAPQTHANSIIIIKMNNLHPCNADDSDDSEEEEESPDSKEPKLKSVLINHIGCVNRIRSLVHQDVVLVASWSELGRVNIWNATSQLKETDESVPQKTDGNLAKPLFSFKGHQVEGYGLDWSSTKKGMLASGDCKHDIHIWHPADGGTWQVDQRPLVGHTKSVEDLQWSPNEQNVLASCSVDKSIRIWDIRSAPNKANKLTVENAHTMDVNVISWNRNEPFVVSGGDDGVIHVWDLRQFKSGSSVASFKHHSQPVTTIEWHPADATVFASGGADHQIVLWDLAVERDSEDNSNDVEGIPSQLLFIHQGQTDIKELHWHPQFSGVMISTALNGFNVFKTISV